MTPVDSLLLELALRLKKITALADEAGLSGGFEWSALVTCGTHADAALAAIDAYREGRRS